MARQVYFDPFGNYTEGVRRGTRDQVTLEDRTRRARNSDFDFDYFEPLRLNKARRADEYGMARLPYDINALDINQRTRLAQLYPQEQKILSGIGLRTGNFGPAQENDLSYLYDTSGLNRSPEERSALRAYYASTPEGGYTPEQSAQAQARIADIYGIPEGSFDTLTGVAPDYSQFEPSYQSFYMAPAVQARNQQQLDFLKYQAELRRRQAEARRSMAWLEFQRSQQRNNAGGGGGPLDIY